VTRLNPRHLVLVAAVSLAATAPSALSADARQAKLPDALSHVPTVQRVYPALWRLEQARKDGVSWERLRRGARELWMLSHKCADATLERRYRRGARSSWDTVLATWRCSGLSESWIATRACLADHEGGRTYPDVRFGGGRGYPGGYGNIVFGHLQVRPGWYRGAMEGRPGTYASDHWDYALYRWALSPINQARTAAFIGTEQFATAGLCS